VTHACAAVLQGLQRSLDDVNQQKQAADTVVIDLRAQLKQVCISSADLLQVNFESPAASSFEAPHQDTCFSFTA